MKRYVFVLCLFVSCIYAADSSDEQNPPDLVLVGQDHGQRELHLDMDQFAQSLQTSISHLPSFTSSRDTAQYLTQIIHGDTVAQPTFVTDAFRSQIKKIKRENPAKHARLLAQLTEHKSKAIRSISIGNVTQALQQEITPEMVSLFFNAWQDSYTQQTGTISEQQQKARMDRIKFWFALGTTVIGAIGTAVATAFATSGSC